MKPKIIESHSEVTVNVLEIIERIIKFLPEDIYKDLNEIVVLDNHDENSAFGCYINSQQRIELYLDSILSWQPWILKKTYLFPYITIGMALGHELDHHVNRNLKSFEKEKSAESNALKYIYPSFGIFKPLAKLLAILSRNKKAFG